MSTKRPSINLLIAPVARETGELLQGYLADRGVGTTSVDYHGVVCYGLPSTLMKSLNGRCDIDKIERLLMMSRAGITTIPWFSKAEDPHGTITYPLLARRTGGHGGEDIVPVFQPEELAWRMAAGWTWFSSYVPVEREYRIWVFRNEIFGAYEKVMKRPHEYRFIGRNFRNGFDFQPSPCPSSVAKRAIGAVRACNLDFAAVDILVGKDRRVYVLEVNTAPGVIRSGAQKTLGMLADYIVEWVKEDYPIPSKRARLEEK